MQIIHNLKDWQALRAQMAPHQSLGFVPTMGNLHPGHMSLCQRSCQDNDLSVASIFVNPTQFDRIDDFNQYPKTLDADLALLEQVGIDYCLLPNTQSIYPDGYRYRIEETQNSLNLEGSKRPGHYNGVLTVVMILFQLIKPQRSYFGEKDYQQYHLIQDMAKAFFLDTEVIVCPTIREASGLAYSSRNTRLSAEERIIAEQFAALFHQKHKSCHEIQTELEQLGIKIDYIEEHVRRRFAAIYIGTIRLIDNYPV